MENNGNRNLFSPVNRGVLLDIVVFLANLFLMRLLAERFTALIKDASNGDEIAGFVTFLFCLGLFVLPAAGAVLKRWHFQRHLQIQGKTVEKDGFVFGCLFNPILIYCVNLIILLIVSVFIQRFFYGDDELNAAVTGSLAVLEMIIAGVQTFLIYRYFSPIKKEPPAFLKSPPSEHLGDVCIFFNMIFFQLAWNWLLFSQRGFPRPSGISDFFSRFVFLFILALFVYFPPRIFYLAEDIHRRRVWLTILLANSPVIFRVIYGAF